MKVLHVSHSGLPDKRIERSALTGKRHNYKIYFVGLNIEKTYIDWDGRYKLRFGKLVKVGEKRAVSKIEKCLMAIVDEVDPDIVHAHDLFSAKLMHDLDLAMVYDDHEYWSKASENFSPYRKRIYGLPIFYPLKLYTSTLWSRWEKEVLSNHPTITVSESIAEDHRRICDHVEAVYNYPYYNEVKELEYITDDSRSLGVVYVGSDIFGGGTKVRDTRGVIDVFRGGECGILTIIGDRKFEDPYVKSIGKLNYPVMLKQLSKYDIGIIPWKANPLHRFCSPNKVFDYIHTGLRVIIPYTMSDIIDLFTSHRIPHQIFSDMKDLARKLKQTAAYKKRNIDYLSEMRSSKEISIKYARKHLVWDTQEDKILAQYDLLVK